MVDYFALIAPTIESLAKSAVEERRQVYDRLIKMLEAQLRSADPPRSEIDILRERIDLEAAIRRVERRIQAGQLAVGTAVTADSLRAADEQIRAQTETQGDGSSTAPLPPPTKIKLPGPADASQQGISAVEGANPSPDMTGAVTPISSEGRVPGATPPRPTDWASLVPQPRPVDHPQSFGQRGVPRPPLPPGPPIPPGNLSQDQTPPGPPRRIPPGAISPPGLPPRPHVPLSSRQVSPQSGEPDAGRPIYGPREGDPRPPASRLRDLPAAFRSMPGALASQRPPSRAGEPPRPPIPREPPMPPLAPEVVEAGRALSQPQAPYRRPEMPVAPDAQRIAEEIAREEAEAIARNARLREPQAESQSSTDASRPTVSIGRRPRASMLPIRATGSWQRMGIISACIIAILGGIAMTAYLLRDDPAEFKNATGKYAATDKPAAEEKIADRLAPQQPKQDANSAKPGSPSQSNSQTPTNLSQSNVSQANPSAPVPDANGVLTQKAMLVMDSIDPSAPLPSLNGRVTWKLETLKSVVNNASEIGSRATIDIPEVGLTAAFVFRRNRDPQSANSHMIEVTFTLTENNTTGKVRDIRVPELRTDENARGTQLSGIPVPVTENVFLVGLNALPSEMQKNLDLLRSQNWFAMPLRFANGKRGILMFEKGKTGERVMEDAMQAWKAN